MTSPSAATRFLAHAGNLLTALRIGLVPVFLWLLGNCDGQPLLGSLAVLVFAVVAASDVLDGRAIRRWGCPSPAGRYFDHLADILFLLTALSAFVWRGELPWWVPASVALAFSLYLLELRQGPFRPPPHPQASRLGHLGGMANYALVGVLVTNHATGLDLLPESWLRILFALVPLYSGLPILLRIRAAFRPPRVRPRHEPENGPTDTG